MTQEDKDLLLKDLSARLPYKVKVHVKFYGDFDDEIQEYTFILNSIDTHNPSHCYWIGGEQLRESGKFEPGTTGFSIDIDDDDQEVKPYLRPMSSMTTEESKEYDKLCGWVTDEYNAYRIKTIESQDWLLAHHFDYRGLIEEGLALEAPEGMYD